MKVQEQMTKDYFYIYLIAKDKPKQGENPEA